MEDYFLYCEDCGWHGHETELVAKTDRLDDNYFVYCPDCGSKNLSEEEE